MTKRYTDEELNALIGATLLVVVGGLAAVAFAAGVYGWFIYPLIK